MTSSSCRCLLASACFALFRALLERAADEVGVVPSGKAGAGVGLVVMGVGVGVKVGVKVGALGFGSLLGKERGPV